MLNKTPSQDLNYNVDDIYAAWIDAAEKGYDEVV